MKHALAASSFALIASTTAIAQQPALQVDWFQSPVNGLWCGVDFSIRNWTSAETMANSIGGHLATIRDASEQAWIASTFEAYKSPGVIGGLWIGLVQAEGAIEPSNGWGWISGEPASYLNWFAGEPNNTLGSEDVAVMEFQGTEPGQWNDGNGALAVHRGLLESPSPVSEGWSWPRSASTATRPNWGCLADLDGDGDLDYTSPNGGAGSVFDPSPDTVSIHWNNGQGDYTAGPVSAVPAEPTVVISFDAGSDGDADLLVSCSTGQELILLENVEGQFAPPISLDQGLSFAGLAAGDLDGDGREDIVAAAWDGSSSQSHLIVYLAQPDGSFTSGGNLAQGASGRARWPEVADLNGDGSLDIVASYTHSGSRVRLYLNDGSGSFSLSAEFMAGSDPMRPLPVDLESDGDLDLAVPMADQDRVAVWTNDGVGVFTPSMDIPTGDAPQDIQAADVDADGAVDLTVAHWDDSEVRLYSNDGTGVFASYEYFSTPDGVLTALLDDLDGDAGPDLLVPVNSAAEFRTWINNRDADCNGNGIPDLQDIAAGLALDCNGNSTPDSCDIANGFSKDQDGNGIPDECVPAPLASSLEAISIATGGQQDLSLNASADLGLKLYFILGSASGTSPGISLNGVHLPLQVFDPYFLYSVSEPNAPPFVNTLGVLDPLGVATATIDIPVGQPGWVGITLNHAYLVFGGDQSVLFASNPVPLVLVP